MASDVMTVEELADYLKLDPQTIYRKFRKGELPGVRIGKAIRFKRDVIEVVTPGTTFSDKILDTNRNNFLAACVQASGKGAAGCMVGTGVFRRLAFCCRFFSLPGSSW